MFKLSTGDRWFYENSRPFWGVSSLRERQNHMANSKRYQSAIRDEKKRILASRTEKYCRHCDTVKAIDEFYPPSVSGLTGISCWCKECIREDSKSRYWRKYANRIGERRLKCT